MLDGEILIRERDETERGRTLSGVCQNGDSVIWYCVVGDVLLALVQVGLKLDPLRDDAEVSFLHVFYKRVHIGIRVVQPLYAGVSHSSQAVTA